MLASFACYPFGVQSPRVGRSSRALKPFSADAVAVWSTRYQPSDHGFPDQESLLPGGRRYRRNNHGRQRTIRAVAGLGVVRGRQHAVPVRRRQLGNLVSGDGGGAGVERRARGGGDVGFERGDPSLGSSRPWTATPGRRRALGQVR